MLVILGPEKIAALAKPFNLLKSAQHWYQHYTSGRCIRIQRLSSQSSRYGAYKLVQASAASQIAIVNLS
jgi:hypothetical protein